MNKVSVDRRTVGLNFGEDGSAETLIWAPEAKDVALLIDGDAIIPLTKGERGYWYTNTGDIQPGMSYQVLIGDDALPDIASLNQPDIHGASVAFSPHDFDWTDGNWTGIALEEFIIYELHTGTFTPEGTFSGIIQKLDYLKDLGVNAIELMPVAAFPGDRNWGYDGVFPFAVHNSYGGPAGLQQLVDACHQRGFAVVLDVVYNHLGPEGNYFGQYGPYFTNKYQTPWGHAVNFDDAGCDAVRRYFIENALMWFRDFHIDALRLDAVHAIKDFSPKHLLREIREYTDMLMAKTGRRHLLIVECDLNDPRFIDPLGKRGYGMDAQWTDEFHHALRVSAGGERSGYYSDFTPTTDLAGAYQHAYVYRGQYSVERQKSFGNDPVDNAGRQFVVFSQNHDQVGNRMLGERSSQLFSFEMQKLLAAAIFVSPFIPMLFMGEEYSESNPFLYFVSHTDPDLIEAVRKGRRDEFKAFHAQGEAPDPEAAATFEQSQLQWHLLNQQPHQTMLRYYRALIALRKSEPALRIPDRSGCRVNAGQATNTLTLIRSSAKQQLICLLNFSKESRPVTLQENDTLPEIIFNSADAEWNGPGLSAMSASVYTLQPESILILRSYV
jgi:maltooligosyltrehalose trehalohydrolase